jgi:N-acetylglucosaminyldiphosphoundecaprenol N-acetyl-beta-D-mannosaminyltransferase
MSSNLTKTTQICTNGRKLRFNVLGLPVDAVGMEAALAEVDRLVRTAIFPGYILAANPEKVYAVQSNSFLAGFFQGAALIIPDGIGIVIALRRLYGQRVSRVPGADLMQEICRVAPERGYRIFIYGSSEEVNAGAVRVLQRQHPGIQIVGRANGFHKELEMPALIDQINQSHTDILFIALGSPRQEQWLHRSLPMLNVRVCQCIGGTLDTIVGRVKRAPKAWQRLGLEWLYRLLRQPSRVFRQKMLLAFTWELLLRH